MHKLEHLTGTAVTVQQMVFGNIGGASGSGVGFTRNPATGENSLYVDFLLNAQGEDVVSGRESVEDSERLLAAIPGLYEDLRLVRRRLESLFLDVQDFEFTVQSQRLFLLQTRDAKRTPWAALRFACDLVDEGLIDRETALGRLRDYDLDSICRLRIRNEGATPLAVGTPASLGVASGHVAFKPERALELSALGQAVILVREDAVTADVAALSEAVGLLTVRGARTSHAAVVARQMNKVSIVGCQSLVLRPGLTECQLGGRLLPEGATITLDGATGNVYEGELPTVIERPDDLLARVRGWGVEAPV